MFLCLLPAHRSSPPSSAPPASKMPSSHGGKEHLVLISGFKGLMGGPRGILGSVRCRVQG